MTSDPLQWFRSSYSGQGGECVEVAPGLVASHGVVPVRDAKRPAGPVLRVGVPAFAGLVAMAKSTRLAA
ncbi:MULTISPECIES: DUF397 domain-containing protein [unclassified Streptomyces]|uniref:DUF397 domain-containing protein n=1 Tax=unclassified Streptomyces TaxID=2593676 RepID=UPI0005BB0941|nr:MULTISPECIES: DUF397 domain-containing protein [unclassified Streptomyces]ASY34783.1 DUF397 domain-containing protein [Streptomyces sp. CLI2509]MYX23410.1 DUF397 domain-containing protein [Streptomyces sp. SID8380]